jgi:hypothetical protein
VRALRCQQSQPRVEFAAIDVAAVEVTEAGRGIEGSRPWSTRRLSNTIISPAASLNVSW